MAGRMSHAECHCGKDGHPLGSVNCPIHGTWRPIETAPCGKNILVYGGIGIWKGPLIAFVHENYNDHHRTITEGSAGSVLSMGSKPTHWMPLPEPPVAA